MNLIEDFWTWVHAARTSFDPKIDRNNKDCGYVWHQLRNSGHLRGGERLELFRRLRAELHARQANERKT